MWELEKHPTASAWNYIPGGSDVGTALGRRQEHPPAQPSSRELPGTLLPQQIPRPHKSLTQLLVLRPEVKACRSAWGVGTAEADPCAGAVLLSKLLFNFLTVWFGVAQEGKTPWPAPFPRRSCHLQSTQKVPAITHCLKAASPRLAELHLPLLSQTETVSSGLAGVHIPSQIISMSVFTWVLPQFQRGKEK